ncbi:hypothetical protein [Pontibacter pamirensis]|uniref:hypothetical protein n=1 Tax=Pontibacter pamirensis TaxID=2562824 RepID=UPI0013898BBD|nr:hypothetical protein [Pontibacter pamirensis]
MKIFTSKAVASSTMALFLPIMFSCSVLSGNSVSDDPYVAAQQQEVRALEQEVRQAEQYAEEAKQREKAAKSRLKAAEYELKALEQQAKRRNSY